MENRHLYKAKTTKKEGKAFNNVWVTGSLIVARNKYYIHPVGNMVNVENELGKIVIMHEVDPSTICQCTGLKDNNGNLIFENDILELFDKNNDYSWKAIVKFGNPNCEYVWGWNLKAIEEYEGNIDILLWIEMEDTGAFCEIVGNVFDNPELLEGKINDN